MGPLTGSELRVTGNAKASAGTGKSEKPHCCALRAHPSTSSVMTAPVPIVHSRLSSKAAYGSYSE
jgi:hypothetical protein